VNRESVPYYALYLLAAVQIGVDFLLAASLYSRAQAIQVIKASDQVGQVLLGAYANLDYSFIFLIGNLVVSALTLVFILRKIQDGEEAGDEEEVEE
jgi:hypothetical protein